MPKYHIRDTHVVTIFLVLIVPSRTTFFTSSITSSLQSTASTDELSTNTALFSTTYLQSTTGTVEPSTSTALFTTTSLQFTTDTEEPTASTALTTSISLQTTTGTEEPSTSTALFTTTSLQFTTGTEEPTATTALTTAISLQPTTGTEEPSTRSALFTTTSLQFTTGTEEPTSTALTTAISFQPTTGTEEPSTSTVLTTMTSPWLTRTILQGITGTVFTAITSQPSEITTEQPTANTIWTKTTSPRSTSSAAMTTLISPQWTTPNPLEGTSTVFATSTLTKTTSDTGASDAYVPGDSKCETTPLYIVIGILAGVILFLLMVLIAMFVRHNRIVAKSKQLPIPSMPMVCPNCREITHGTGFDNVYVALDPESRNIPEEKPYDVLRRVDPIETPAVNNIYYCVKENEMEDTTNM